MNLESSGGALQVSTNSKLTINGANSNLYFGNKKWDEYNDAATIYMDEGSKLEINAGNLTTSGGAETNLKLFDNAQAKINLTGDFISDSQAVQQLQWKTITAIQIQVSAFKPLTSLWEQLIWKRPTERLVYIF